jgi:hypothetical protein
VVFGKITQINVGYLPDLILEKEYGLKKKMNINYMGPGPEIDTLLDDLVDASIQGTYPILG